MDPEDLGSLPYTETLLHRSHYLARARAATSLPLAVGFGVKEKSDVDFLRGKADIAVVGSETLRVLEHGGLAAVGPFLSALR